MEEVDAVTVFCREIDLVVGSTPSCRLHTGIKLTGECCCFAGGNIEEVELNVCHAGNAAFRYVLSDTIKALRSTFYKQLRTIG